MIGNKGLIFVPPSITFWGEYKKKHTTVHLYLTLNCLNANYQLMLLSKLLSVMGCDSVLEKCSINENNIERM